MQLYMLEPPFKIFYTFVRKTFSSCRLKFPGENCRQIHEKSKASVWRNLSTGMAPEQPARQPFYENYTTLELHNVKLYCNFSRGCQLVKIIASKHVTGHSRLHKLP